MAKIFNPIVFLDVTIDGATAERMVFELFADIVPKTAENFRSLCTGEMGCGAKTGKPLHYKGSIFHRIIRGFMAQGGDFSRRDGTGGESIYGGKFADENFVLKHDGPGLLSMANASRDSNGSQFFITFKSAPHLDGKHVVFGKLIVGHRTLRKIESVDLDGDRPVVPVKIVNCGELIENFAVVHDSDKKDAKLKQARDASTHDSLEGRKGQHKKSSKGRRKRKRKRYYSSEDSSSDSETQSSDTDSVSDSDSSSMSDFSSSSDDRRHKRWKRSRTDKHKRGKRRRDRRKEKRRKRHEKKLKHKTKKNLESESESESTDGSSSNDSQDHKRHMRNSQISSHASDERRSPLSVERETATDLPVKVDIPEKPVGEEAKSQRENGELQSNGIKDRLPGPEGNNQKKSRSQSKSLEQSMSKSMSNSSRSQSERRNLSPKRSVSRSPPTRDPSKSPAHIPRRSISRNSPHRSISISPSRRNINRSPTGTVIKSPVRHSQRSKSRSPIKVRSRSVSRSPSRSLHRRNRSSSLEKFPMHRSLNRSPVKEKERSISRSSGRSLRRRSPSRSPVKPRRSVSRSPVRSSSRSKSHSPIQTRLRRSISRSQGSPVRRATSPSNRRRSLSRSASLDGSPKRVRRGRGFSQKYSFARRYRTPSPDRSTVRLHRYGGRNDRDRYSSHRSYHNRSSPIRYRSPPRGRSPPRYRSWRNRSRSMSRSPVNYRSRGRGGYSKSPSRSRSPDYDKSRTRGARDSIRSEKRGSVSRSRSPSGSRSRSRSRSSPDTPSPKHVSKDQSKSPSSSSDGKRGLVSYGGASPDSGGK